MERIGHLIAIIQSTSVSERVDLRTCISIDPTNLDSVFHLTIKLHVSMSYVKPTSSWSNISITFKQNFGGIITIRKSHFYKGHAAVWDSKTDLIDPCIRPVIGNQISPRCHRCVSLVSADRAPCIGNYILSDKKPLGEM